MKIAQTTCLMMIFERKDTNIVLKVKVCKAYYPFDFDKHFRKSNNQEFSKEEAKTVPAREKTCSLTPR